jgi:hypothetical protein
VPEWAILLAVWVISAAWIAFYLRRGWVPHDEGTLAQSAERVLRGEIPHRDFIDVYSGGLAFLDAAGFRLFGVSLLVPRAILLAFALVWVPAVYAVARRFGPPLAAGGVTLAAVAWSVPNYTAAMPSWFNLFFATFGLAALLRWQDARRARWLVIAGACGGLSILFKIVGLYFVAAGIIALLFAEQNEPGPSDGADGPRANGGEGAWRALLLGGLGGFTLALVMLVRARIGAPEVLNFVVPGAALSALVVWNERNAPALPFAARLRRALRLLGPFLAGVAIPVALFALAYAAIGALGGLVEGVLVLPFRRLASAALRPPPLIPTLLASLPLLALLVAPGLNRVRAEIGGLVALAVLAALAWVPSNPALYQWSFLAVRAALPLSVVIGCVLVARSRATVRQRNSAVAVFAAAAVCGIIQYPFSAPVYFCFVAPLAILAAAAAFSLRPEPPRGAGVLVLAYVALFAAVWVNRGTIFTMGMAYVPSNQTEPLPLPIGGGIRVPPLEAAGYARLATEMRAHAGGSPWAWAGPDAPELYPLSGLRNPTRNLFEFFDDPATFEPRLLETLDARGVKVVAVNRLPDFSRPLSPAALAALEAHFPQADTLGPFVVRWRP